MGLVLVAVGSLGLVVVALQVWRLRDRSLAAAAWRSLRNRARSPGSFDPATLAELPGPARRFFEFAIAPGAPLATVAEIVMHGELGLGTKDEPRYAAMRAEQILAPPYGLVWEVVMGRGALRIAGSDGCADSISWVRFWLAGTVPVVRAGGTPDHLRAALGRVVAEAAFWAPASLLPQFGVGWEAAADNVARATVRHAGMTQTVDVTVAPDGRPLAVVIPRWTDANPDRQFRLQPFGGYLSAFRSFDGFRLPTRVEGGNFFGTDDYFPFYKAEVETVRFIG